MKTEGAATRARHAKPSDFFKFGKGDQFQTMDMFNGERYCAEIFAVVIDKDNDLAIETSWDAERSIIAGQDLAVPVWRTSHDDEPIYVPVEDLWVIAEEPTLVTFLDPFAEMFVMLVRKESDIYLPVSLIQPAPRRPGLRITH